jgi:MFS family permease
MGRWLELKLDSYEYITQPITDERRKRNCLMIFGGTLLLSGYLTHLLHKISLYSKLENFNLLWLFPIFIFIIGLSFTWLCWNKKEKKVLTPESVLILKARKKDLESKWYFRYFFSVILLVSSYASLIAYLDGINVSGLALIVVNPISGILTAVGALIFGWEIALVTIIGVVLYYFFLGVSALPVSLAIILGALLIATIMYRRKT